jgi:hypothetical protein
MHKLFPEFYKSALLTNRAKHDIKLKYEEARINGTLDRQGVIDAFLTQNNGDYAAILQEPTGAVQSDSTAMVNMKFQRGLMNVLREDKESASANQMKPLYGDGKNNLSSSFANHMRDMSRNTVFDRSDYNVLQATMTDGSEDLRKYPVGLDHWKYLPNAPKPKRQAPVAPVRPVGGLGGSPGTFATIPPV